MNIKRNKEILILLAVMLLLFLVFIFLYQENQIPIEEADKEIQVSSLDEWTLDQSLGNGQALKEDKSIYERDDNIYDVYISAFPTKDETGEIIDLSAFGKHQARDHTYNPTLYCNIQILEEGGKLDPLLNLDSPNGTIRVRGNTARGDLYKSYKIKLDDEAKDFKGQTILNINKNSQDDVKVTTKFCTEILKEMEDMVSYRTNFMRVWVRDTSLPVEEQKYEYFGLYTHIEQPNKTSLEARALSSNCEMYKARNFSFQLTDAIKNVDDPNYSREEFETVFTIREAESHEKLIDMLDVVNDPTTNFEEVMENYFNEENYISWLAFNILVGAGDILSHNFIIYSPNNIQTWYFIPWDFDGNMSQKRIEATPISLRGGQQLNQVILHRRFLRFPGNLEKLQTKMKELMGNQLSEENISNITSGYTEVLEKTMMLEPDLSLLKIKPNELLPYIKSYPEIVEANYKESLQAFEYPAPMFVSNPKKNEDGSLLLSWDNSYSYQGRTITYNVQIANDYYMRNILFERKANLKNELNAMVDLDPGTYYLKVTAVDSEGNEQLSLEHYKFDGNISVYESGVLEFTID